MRKNKTSSGTRVLTLGLVSIMDILRHGPVVPVAVLVSTDEMTLFERSRDVLRKEFIFGCDCVLNSGHWIGLNKSYKALRWGDQLRDATRTRAKQSAARKACV